MNCCISASKSRTSCRIYVYFAAFDCSPKARILYLLTADHVNFTTEQYGKRIVKRKSIPGVSLDAHAVKDDSHFNIAGFRVEVIAYGRAEDRKPLDVVRTAKRLDVRETVCDELLHLPSRSAPGTICLNV